jgi:hypothetical protein
MAWSRHSDSDVGNAMFCSGYCIFAIVKESMLFHTVSDHDGLFV